ncbi:DUF3048 domain-containing protein [Candidatus Saccharibacteria bacterium]|nr:DUF3048 domain-containing protein [Candidatus Saccharibacteria bacterium]
MDTNNHIVTNEELASAFGGAVPQTPVASSNNGAGIPDKQAKKPTKKQKWDKLTIAFYVIGGLGIAGGVTMLLFSLLTMPETVGSVRYPDLTKKESGEKVYSNLTGEVLADASLKNAPAYCIQTPNGTDGARPHAGLNQAGVIFEAIAEAGITRFAAIYQNPTASIIGPIRSLRIYYLQWDTPFDCTIVHAGGSGDALAAVSRGYKNLDENYSYMYRGTYGSRLWNNLFTTAGNLRRFSEDNNYTTSEIKGFARMTPEESERSRIDELVIEKLNIVKPSTKNTAELKPAVANISFRLGGWGDFNVNYQYDATSNKYLRSYESGSQHQVYSCPEGDGGGNPEDSCNLTQMTPSVVIAMMVSERRAADNYHEDIDVIGMGDAYIFQNGVALSGTWKKDSTESQIQFLDSDNKEIRLAPGQTMITAVPNYGSVAF